MLFFYHDILEKIHINPIAELRHTCYVYTEVRVMKPTNRPIALHGSYFRKMLLSCLIFFYVPLLAWSFAYARQQRSAYIEKAAQRQQSRLDYAAALLDSRLSAITKTGGLIANAIGMSDGKTRVFASDATYQLINTLCNTNELISDIWLRFGDERWIYTRARKLVLEYAPPGLIHSKTDRRAVTVDGEAYLDTMNNPAQFNRFSFRTVDISRQETVKGVLYTSPAIRSGARIGLLATVVIQKETLQRFLAANVLAGEGAKAVLLDNDGTILCETGFDEWESDAALTLAASDIVDARYNVKTLPARWQLQESQSLAAGWILLLAADTRRMAVPGMLAWEIVTLFAILLLGAFGLYVFMRVNYRPISSIVQRSREVLNVTLPQAPADGLTPAVNEMDEIRLALSHLDMNVRRLASLVDRNREALFEETFMDILSGRIADREVLDMRMRGLSVDLSGCRFRMLAARARSGAEEEPVGMDCLERLEEVLHNTHGSRIRFCRLSAYPASDALYLVVLHGEAFDAGILESTGLVVGVGKETTDVMTIGYSCLEAFTALDFHTVLGWNVLEYASILEVFPQIERFESRKSILRMLGSGALHAATSDQFRGLFAGFARLVGQASSSVAIRKLCLTAYFCAIETLNHISGSGKPLISQNILRDLFALLTAKDALAFLRHVEEAALAGMKPAAPDISVLVEKLEESCFDPDFSLGELALSSGMSQSTFTRLFKTRTGMPPLAYMTELRMKEAARLLRETRTPVAQVALAVGYMNTASFGRHFREYAQASPSEYRAGAGEQSE
jgi:AraC-like DNA-binding protein